MANKGGWTPLYLATDNRNIEGGDYPVPKPDMDHLEYIKLLLDHGADPNGRVQGQHADAHDLHDAVVLRGRLHAVRARGAIERHRADAAAARLGRRSVHGDGVRRHRADGRRRHRLGRRRHLRALAEGQPRRREDARVPRPRRQRGQPRRPHAADGRGAQGPQRRRAVPRRPRREAGAARRRQPRHDTRRPRSWPATPGRRSTTPTAWCASACSRPSTGPRPPR